MSQITILVSSDLKNFEVPTNIAKYSVLVETMLEGIDDDKVEVPLSNVSGDILARVITFLEYNDKFPIGVIDKPIKSVNMSENFETSVGEDARKWYADFVDKLPQEVLFDLILAANFMDIKCLLDLCCAKVASLIKGKTPEEIRSVFKKTNEENEKDKDKNKNENENEIETVVV